MLHPNSNHISSGIVASTTRFVIREHWSVASWKYTSPRRSCTGRRRKSSLSHRAMWASRNPRNRDKRSVQKESKVLLDWCRQRAQESCPWTPYTRTRNFWQNHRQKKWHTKFEKRHRENLKARPAKLDPKRALKTSTNHVVRVGDQLKTWRGLLFQDFFFSLWRAWCC